MLQLIELFRDKLFIYFISIQGLVQGYVPDRRYVATMSIPEQQPTVGYTENLGLTIEFLPGEDDVKLREGRHFEF